MVGLSRVARSGIPTSRWIMVTDPTVGSGLIVFSGLLVVSGLLIIRSLIIFRALIVLRVMIGVASASGSRTAIVAIMRILSVFMR